MELLFQSFHLVVQCVVFLTDNVKLFIFKDQNIVQLFDLFANYFEILFILEYFQIFLIGQLNLMHVLLQFIRLCIVFILQIVDDPFVICQFFLERLIFKPLLDQVIL